MFSLIFLLDTASAFLAKRHVTARNEFSREPPSRRLRRAKGNQEGQNINLIGVVQSGIDGTLGQVNNSTYISNIRDQDVPLAEAFFVFIDSSGKLGTSLVDAAGNRVSVPASQASKPQAMSNRKVEELQATVAQLTQQLKEQAAQIQKVSAQLEVSKPAPQVVVNKP